MHVSKVLRHTAIKTKAITMYSAIRIMSTRYQAISTFSPPIRDTHVKAWPN
ncbi:MAG: hypothetical protein IPP63_18845 [Chloracidobacterium sp.]|nr:hypothetical protein [Chloracidobacterium sp.]